MAGDSSSAAELVNSCIENTVPFVRFMIGENLVQYPHPVWLVNIATMLLRDYQIYDIQDINLPRFFRENIVCDCVPCKDIGPRTL